MYLFNCTRIIVWGLSDQIRYILIVSAVYPEYL